jgi:cell division septation protein DedD
MAAAAPPPEQSRGKAPLQRQAAAKSSVAEGTGFVVQLSAARSEAEAQSTFRALKLKYAALKDREPMVRRKDQGKRGVFYAVQIGPFASQGDAQQLCEQIKAAGGTCFTTKN